MKTPIYLDYHATTPVDPRVLEAMLPSLRARFGNPSSANHSFGREASLAVERARGQVAELLGATEAEIFFTAGGTEGANLAIAGVARAMKGEGRNHLVTMATEHKAVLKTCEALASEGFTTTVLPLGPSGVPDPRSVEQALTERTLLVSVMAANNEVGSLAPLAEIAARAHRRGALFHTDAAQAVGKIPIAVRSLEIDLLSLSGHKLYAPKGVGALFRRGGSPRIRIQPLLHGGGQEGGLRSGTLNVPGIVGLGEACSLAREELTSEAARISVLRDRLWKGLCGRLDGVRLNGPVENRLPGNLNVSFEAVDGEALLEGLPEIAVSSGSACISSTREGSYVLRALGVSEELANSSIRFGLGRWTTEEEIDFAIERVAEEVGRLRRLSPRAHGKSPRSG